jgi:hypothetical protein
MSKTIRTTTVVRRPSGARVAQRPIYVIASGGEVFIARRTKDTLAWVPANENDFDVPPAAAANDPIFNNLEKR